MKLLAALLVLAIAPILTPAIPPAAGDAGMSPATTNRASAHDRHRHRRAGVKHKHHTVPKHHAQPH